MMDIFTPANHQGAYEWAAVFLAHFAIGLTLVAAVAAVLDWVADEWIDHRGHMALIITTAGYWLIWEGIVQAYGAGLADAVVDTFAIAMGGVIGIAAWRRHGVALAAGLVASMAVLWSGVRVRK